MEIGFASLAPILPELLVAFGALLSEGIGDTIRVSLSAPPVEEIKVGDAILQSLNLRPRKLEIVSCPSCGRAPFSSTHLRAHETGLDIGCRLLLEKKKKTYT